MSSDRRPAAPPAKRPGLREVAHLAGTSTAVVSYVINGGPRPVAPGTRARVEEAVRTLGYRPNSVARSLRTQRTGTLGLVVPDLRNGFFSELAASIESAALIRGQRLLICSTDWDGDRETMQLDGLLDAQVDGLMIAPTRAITQPFAILEAAQIPTVVLHHHPDQTMAAASPSWQPAWAVGEDHDAGRIAAEHLLGHGHRQVACLAGPGEDTPVGRRAAGFRAEVARATGESGECLDITCDYADLPGTAYRACVALLARKPEITAVCATTDMHALGAIRAAVTARRRIGDDLALISIDGTQTTDHLTPALTVLRFPFNEVGRWATAAATDLPRHANKPTLPYQLVRRVSCGCDVSG